MATQKQSKDIIEQQDDFIHTLDEFVWGDLQQEGDMIFAENAPEAVIRMRHLNDDLGPYLKPKYYRKEVKRILTHDLQLNKDPIYSYYNDSTYQILRDTRKYYEIEYNDNSILKVNWLAEKVELCWHCWSHFNDFQPHGALKEFKFDLYGDHNIEEFFRVDLDYLLERFSLEIREHAEFLQKEYFPDIDIDYYFNNGRSFD